MKDLHINILHYNTVVCNEPAGAVIKKKLTCSCSDIYIFTSQLWVLNLLILVITIEHILIFECLCPHVWVAKKKTDTIVSCHVRYFAFMLLSLCGYVLFVVSHINVCVQFMFVFDYMFSMYS